MAAPDSGVGMKRLHEALQREEAGDLPEARRLGEQALEAYLESGDRTGQAAAHQLLATVLATQGEPSRALEHVEAAIPLREETGDAHGLASLLQGRFELALALGRPALQQRAAEDLLALLARSGDRDGQTRARHQLAQILLDAGQTDAASEHVARGMELCDRAGEERARAALTLLGARIDLAEGHPQRALLRGADALRLARATARRPIVVDALEQLAGLQLRLDQLAPARASLEEALDGREAMKDLRGRARVLGQLAQVEQAMGLPGAALGRLRYAARSFEELGDRDAQLEALHAAAELAVATGELPLALEISAQQVEAAEAHGEPGVVAAAWHVRAGRRVQVGDLAGAAEAFQRSAQARAQAGQVEAEGVSLAMLGQVQAALGQRALALDSLTRARDALRQAGSSSVADVEALIADLG